MKKIYCFLNGGSTGFFQVVGLAEDGNCLSGHASSNEHWAKHDIGINSDWKHDHYDEHYGAGNWELEWVDKPTEHAGCMAAIRLCEAQGEAAESEPA